MNESLTADFEAWLTHSGYRDSTIRRSVQDVRQLFEWLAEGREVPRRLGASVKRLRFYFERHDLEPEGRLLEAMEAVLAPPPPRTPLEARRARQARQKKRQTSYADADWRALWMAIHNDHDPAARVLEVMATTGLRVGDVLRLRRAQLAAGLAKGIITIEQKGGDERLVYIEGGEEPWVRLHLAFDSLPQTVTNVALLVSPDGDGSPLSANAAYRAVERKLKRLGDELHIEGPHRTHRLRRTVAVQALRVTEDVTMVQQLLGHRNVNTTFGYISEARPEREAALRRKLGQVFRPEDDDT